MNILQVSDVSLSKVIGGAERVLFEQSARLSQRGHRVFVLTRRLPCHNLEREIIRGVEEWRYPILESNPAAFLYSICRAGKRLFERLEQSIGFDCIHFHQPFSALGVLLSKHSQKKRKIYTCHSLSFEEYLSRNAMPLSIKGKMFYCLNVLARRFIERQVLKGSDRVLVLSRFTRERVMSAHGVSSSRITVLPGGVDILRFHPKPDKRGLRGKSGVPLNQVIALTIRNLVPRMGLENLISAIGLIAEQTPKLQVVIGGSGPLGNVLKKQIQDLGLRETISLAGFIPESDLPDYYRMADMFVLPTRELEGFGLVTLEAMASGLPVLGTPVGGTKELLEDVAPEWLFRSTAPEDMAELILKAYQTIRSSPDQWRLLSQRCRLHVETYYNWETHIDALEQLMQVQPS
jgi:glycosyltransferase involved in cell wall biosynthesis